MAWLKTLLANWRTRRARARAERAARVKEAKRYAIHIAANDPNLHLRKGTFQ